MATVTTFVDNVSSREDIGGRSVIAENKLDFSATSVSASDVVQALNIPANALVDKVWSYVQTAEGSAGNFDVGDGTDPNGWDGTVNVNSAALSYTLEATDAYGAGKLYTAADTIDIVPSIGLSTAVVIICARYTVLEQV